MMYYYNDYASFFPFHFFGFFFMIFFWALIILVVIRLLRGTHGIHGYGHRDPVEILKERYAKGEITKEQFESMKKDLK